MRVELAAQLSPRCKPAFPSAGAPDGGGQTALRGVRGWGLCWAARVFSSILTHPDSTPAPSSDNQKGSRHCQVSPRGQNLPWLRTTAVNTDSLLLLIIIIVRTK